MGIFTRAKPQPGEDLDHADRVKAQQRITFAACMLGLVASVGGFMFGYVRSALSLSCLLVFAGYSLTPSSGQISGFFLMQDYINRFGDPNVEEPFSAARQGTIVGLLSVGCLFGCLVAGKLADVIGRRLTISVAAFSSLVGITIQISSDTAWYQFAIGRLMYVSSYPNSRLPTSPRTNAY
jgi:MFS transporter, SP family, sugar:H+ symporter